ncbi:MAG: 6-pyruvoyl-tetrahydropterin synthase-related protein [Verrucomicrobiia bacterium]
MASAKPSSDSTGAGRRTIPARIGLWITLAAAAAYCVWLGAHWLPLGYSDKEFGGFVSRLWDIRRELAQHHYLPWWTPYYMSGSSYGLNHSQGFYLLPSLFFALFCNVHTAVKLTALLAVFGGAVAMYFCARYFLRNEWAAALAAIAFLLHPEQIIRAAGAEHLGVIVFMPFMPLTFWLFARALETGRFRDIFWCSLSAFGLLWTHNKMAFVHAVFLFGYLVYWLWPRERRAAWRATARTLARLGVVTAGLCAVLIAPGLVESKYVKLLSGEHEQLIGWQHGYAFKSLLALVDRDGAITTATTSELSRELQAQAFHPTTQEEANRMRESLQRLFSLTSESPEKYAGLALLAVLAMTALWNHRRVNRSLFWFFIGVLLVSIMLAYGPSTVWQANWQTAQAIFGLDGTPAAIRWAVLLSLAAMLAFLGMFYRCKLTAPRKCLWAVGALAAFLFLPAFPILAAVPLFKEIRAPYVFYDGPGTFFVAMLAGFFVTDVLGANKWRAQTPKIVALIAVLLLIDYWPYQKPAKDNGVPAYTLDNLRATYAALKQDGDWMKVYVISGRYFHLLGPMWSGKPQVYEAFYNWMAPLGTGLLNQTGAGSLELLNLFAARYVVFDKTDPDMQSPQMQQALADYRHVFPVALENKDFTVFRNGTAHAYVTAYARACLFDGDVRNSPRLALALAARNWPLVHGPAGPDATLKYERVYHDGEAPMAPLRNGDVVPLADVQLSRENNQQVRIRLNAPRDCLAVIAESYYPFWRAEVDGRPAEVLRVSCALMGVNAPSGAHEIVLRYKPPRSYAVAGLVSGLALLGCLVALVCESAREP